jgi:hypothetical protein
LFSRSYAFAGIGFKIWLLFLIVCFLILINYCYFVLLSIPGRAGARQMTFPSPIYGTTVVRLSFDRRSTVVFDSSAMQKKRTFAIEDPQLALLKNESGTAILLFRQSRLWYCLFI